MDTSCEEDGRELIKNIKIDFVKSPQLNWSCRSNKQMFTPSYNVQRHNSKVGINDGSSQHERTTLSLEHSEKLIIGGTYLIKGELRPFICRVNMKIRFEETQIILKPQTSMGRLLPR